MKRAYILRSIAVDYHVPPLGTVAFAVVVTIQAILKIDDDDDDDDNDDDDDDDDDERRRRSRRQRPRTPECGCLPSV